MIPDAVRELLGADMSNLFAYTFRRMDIAEQEIDAAKRASPRAAKRLHASFKLLCPNDYLRVSDDVYRSHCREILARVKRGEDVTPATDAELAGAFCQATLAAPPSADFAAAYAIVFERLFPGRGDITGDMRKRSYVPGRAEEIVEEFRRKIGKSIGRTSVLTGSGE